MRVDCERSAGFPSVSLDEKLLRSESLVELFDSAVSPTDATCTLHDAAAL